MRSSQAFTFKRALVIAGVCHLALFAVLIFRFSFSLYHKYNYPVTFYIQYSHEIQANNKL